MYRPAGGEAEPPQKIAQAATTEAVAAGQAESGRGDRQRADLSGPADRLAEVERSLGERARTDEGKQSARRPADRERSEGALAEPKAKPTVLASSDDPDAKLPGDPEPARSRQHDRRVSAKAAEATGNAGVSGYQVEAAELLAGAAARRKRRTTTASGLPAPDPATQEPSIKLTRPLRPGVTRPANQD